MTTLKDLSRHLGLSVTQVSRALNNHSDVSKDTKERVMLAAKELEYHPNLMARRLVTGRSGIVGLVYPEMPDPSDSWYFTQFVAGLSSNFAHLGRQFMLHMSQDSDHGVEVYDSLVRSRSIDGFVVIIPEVADARVDFLREKKVPFVLHGQTMEDPDYPFYDIDNIAVGYDLTKRLIRAGHTEIAFINGQEKASFVQRRFIGYARALAEVGLKPRKSFQVTGTMTAELGLRETIRMFQAKGPHPTGIIASNTRIAKGIFDGLAALGLRVPHDVSVVGHDDALPDVTPDQLPVSLTGTGSPLIESWEPLARYLDAALNGARLESVQEIGAHYFFERASVRNI